jgi:hypothetical protein
MFVNGEKILRGMKYWQLSLLLALCLALLYLPFPNRHPQYDAIGYYQIAKSCQWDNSFLLPFNHMLSGPLFKLVGSIVFFLTGGKNLAGWLSCFDSLLMIVALCLLARFYSRIINSKVWGHFAAFFMGVCFETWYFGTDIENISLTLFSTSLLVSLCWKVKQGSQIKNGILSGALAAFSIFCMQYTGLIGLFLAIYYWKRKLRMQSIIHLVTMFTIIISTYVLIAVTIFDANSLNDVKYYVLGYGNIVQPDNTTDWAAISYTTPFRTMVGLSRTMLGLHPLMNLPFLQNLAEQGLKMNIISNQISIARGIASWLQYPLSILTILLLLFIPGLFYFAWKGRKQKTEFVKDFANEPGLLFVYAVCLSLFFTWWIPQAGEYWLSVVIIIIPLAIRGVLGLDKVWRIGIKSFVGGLVIVNLFGSIIPFSDEKVDPRLPLILQVDEIRNSEDIFLVPADYAYPQRWSFFWVYPILQTPNQNMIFDLSNKNRSSYRIPRRVFFIENTLTYEPEGDPTKFGGPFYILTDSDKQWLRTNGRPVLQIGDLVVLGATLP